MAARTYQEKGELAKAEKLLLENLNGDYLTPAGREWRDSLFVLGEVLYAQGRYEEAVRRLQEAVKR
ncbi:MAG: tetratricopeptide repeat protein, partial [Thermoguttaceae bacterium]